MKQKLSLILIPGIINLLVRFIAMTSRIKIVFEDDETVLPLQKYKGSGHLYAFWHGYLLFATYPFRHNNVYAIISRSRDGEILARILKRWGFCFIRGSTSRGSFTVFRDSVKLLKQGVHIGIAPDGPRGPYHRVNPGVVRMAYATDSPITPLGLYYSMKLTLNSWDRFQVPLPFGRITVLIGRPFQIDSTLPKESLGGAEKQLEGRLDELNEKARRLTH
jgi:lysophospholipid acyltransferase (LPLAT)-like uncharacterized protein